MVKAVVAMVLVTFAACVRYETRAMNPRDCPDEPSTAAVGRRDTVAGVVTGAVMQTFDTLRARGLSEASVALLSGGRVVHEANTDSLGRFTFRDVASGAYQLRIRRIGFYARAEAVTIALGAGADLEIVLRPAVLDGCPGYAVLRVRKPWWKWW